MPPTRHSTRTATNRYGQMALEFSRQHHPVPHSRMPDAARFFDEAGQAIRPT
jgi:hypothetical protein